jgi:dynein heavy chain 1
MKIVAEDKVVDRKIRDVIDEWDKDKPLHGDITPDAATSTLHIFEGRMTRLKEEFDLVCKAKEALDLDYTTENRLDIALEELRDLKTVWSSLAKVWQSLMDLKEMLWSSVTPRKVKTQLDQLLATIRDMPTKVRQYPAYEFMQDSLKLLVKVNPTLIDLKSEALRERHWRMIMKSLKIEGKVSFSELTVGHLWDADLRRNEPAVKEIVTIAQGEMALEEFLKQVKEYWTAYSVELVNYQNKCRLIKGWDDLFGKCAEHLNSLSAMKHSPYYKVFEEDASSWEDRLNRIHLLFDVWIDVQRQWVYLEGIFSGSADIKELLPVETARFHNINAEYMGVLKKVYKSALVLDILNIQGIHKSLERLAEMLSKIQKALGEYLERERSAFPRFYFVGDEDLLEIIGNSKDVSRIQKHFTKMFAGISTVFLSGEGTMIEGLSSKEGEVVRLKTPISLSKYNRINEWLSQLEREMKLSLSALLDESLTTLGAFYENDKMDPLTFINWIDAFPAQLVVLCVQITWTRSVEKCLANEGQGLSSLETPLRQTERSLTHLADMVLSDLDPIRRKKCEHLITELVHQRDVIRELTRCNAKSIKDFSWLYHMRYYHNSNTDDPLARLVIKMANASFCYGFEYLGVTDRLVQTPLTDRCYLTLTQALDSRMGGSPFGPAGTGKTESVKALGSQLGRFVLVFCCDENFDFQAMGRIFIGLCRTGAWGCFDEFNRLEERILSAVSQQIQTIQMGLKSRNEIELVNKSLKVHEDTGQYFLSYK